MLTSVQYGDAQLVSLSRAGNEAAFGQIVARYQSLICSLTYNATGNLSRSEDLAQETFVTAWKQIHKLREPERLRSWLCGIARNLINNTSHRRVREPACTAEPMDMAPAVPSPDLLPSEQAISREEEAILWRALEGIPSLYREPLILFYREHQCVEQVAQALELSSDAVKQRLARGRKMLQEEVTAFVEGTLQRTTPGKAFTLGVLAALPVFASSAVAATVGTTGAKITTASKIASTAGLLGSILGPMIGFLGGAFGIWMSIKNTRSLRERQFMIRQAWLGVPCFLLFFVVFFALVLLGRPLAASNPVVFGGVLGLWVACFWAGMLIWIVRSNRRQRQIRIEEGTADSPPPPVPSRGQQLWTVYGSLGGSTTGVLAWILVQAVQAREWVTAAVTVAFGAAVVLVVGRAWLRRPERRVQAIVQALALLGLFTVSVGLVHWHDWTKAAGLQTTAAQAVLIGAGLAAIALLIGAYRRFGPRSLG